MTNCCYHHHHHPWPISAARLGCSTTPAFNELLLDCRTLSLSNFGGALHGVDPPPPSSSEKTGGKRNNKRGEGRRAVKEKKRQTGQVARLSVGAQCRFDCTTLLEQQASSVRNEKRRRYCACALETGIDNDCRRREKERERAQ